MMDIFYNGAIQKWEVRREPFTTIVCPTEKEFEWVIAACDFHNTHSEAQPVLDDGAFGTCPNCECEFNSEQRNEYEINYCPICGQKLDWSEIDEMDQSQ